MAVAPPRHPGADGRLGSKPSDLPRKGIQLYSLPFILVPLPPRQWTTGSFISWMV